MNRSRGVSVRSRCSPRCSTCPRSPSASQTSGSARTVTEDSATALFASRDSLNGTWITADITTASTVISVASTVGFPSSGFLYVGRETMAYHVDHVHVVRGRERGEPRALRQSGATPLVHGQRQRGDRQPRGHHRGAGDHRPHRDGVVARSVARRRRHCGRAHVLRHGRERRRHRGGRRGVDVPHRPRCQAPRDATARRDDHARRVRAQRARGQPRRGVEHQPAWCGRTARPTICSTTPRRSR
jgi:hypothetical protein